MHGDEPHQSSFDPKTIASKAWVRCTVPADRATVIVKIQKREPGGWVDMVTHDDEWRNLVAGKKYIVRTAIGCDYGTYRTAAKGWGRYKGEESGMKDWGYSRTRKDPCKKK